MSLGPFGASNNFSFVNASFIADYPFTLACRYNPNTIATQCLIGYGDIAVDGDRYSLLMSSSGGATCFVKRSGVATSFNSGAGGNISAGVWATFMAVFAAADDRRVYINGGSKNTNTVSANFVADGTKQWRIGRNPSTSSAEANGLMSHAAIWNAALTDEDAAAFGKGFSPRQIRPRNLLSHCPMIRNFRDMRGVIWNVNGTVAVNANNPRFY